MVDYDVIVAGAGVSGATAAAMAGKLGKRVLLIDRNTAQEPGKKTVWGWVCGDAVAKSHIIYVQKNLGNTFSDQVLGLKVDGVIALSPDLGYKLPFDGEGYSLERPLFGKALFDEAIKNGAEFKGKFSIEGPIIENNVVKGVFGKNEKGEEEKIRGKITIDALGIASLLRRKLPENQYIDKEIDYEDLELTGRFIYKTEEPFDDHKYYDKRNALIHLNQQMAPGGYGWVFPKTDGRVNVGLGVQHRSLEIRNKKFGATDNLKLLIEKYIKWNPIFKKYHLDNSSKNGEGYWSVSVRRQMEGMVYPGYIGAGDSMASANPLSAGGIGPALIGGILAGKAASTAVESSDVSLEGLWDYNVDYVKQYGKSMAGMEVFRIFLQSMNNQDIDYGMKSFITYEEAVEITYGRIPELSLTSKVAKLVRGVGALRTFKDLVWTTQKMKELNGIYANYPNSPKEFPQFKKTVVSMIDGAKARMPSGPV
ncbi:MAG: NAD(P)/FAD-dependent oxidoreductase [Candidatus Thermoplasmatota archaeon]|nr:NAD(P)/FAD-dependent oxidoreductase [Candidatus Thermoplasmatota archaeon]MCL6003163.1 NAD(P)/FAD-dependent oxidoreductase [Candidatus Thermoplasmatota archaeon]